jgi:hypothetical protein
MSRKIYSDSILIDTPNLGLTIDETTGRISSTSSASMSYIAYTIGSYSTTQTATASNNIILVNANSMTLTLPASPPNGLLLIIRKTNNVTGSPPSETSTTISAGSNNIRLVFKTFDDSSYSTLATADPVTSFNCLSNGAYMFVYYDGTWYGL